MMGRELGNSPRKGTFGTNISFDIDDTSAPVRRRTKEEIRQAKEAEQLEARRI